MSEYIKFIRQLEERLDKAKDALLFFAKHLGHKVDCGKDDCFACACRRKAQETLDELERKQTDGSSVSKKGTSKKEKGRKSADSKEPGKRAPEQPQETKAETDG